MYVDIASSFLLCSRSHIFFCFQCICERSIVADNRTKKNKIKIKQGVRMCAVVMAATGKRQHQQNTIRKYRHATHKHTHTFFVSATRFQWRRRWWPWWWWKTFSRYPFVCWLYLTRALCSYRNKFGLQSLCFCCSVVVGLVLDISLHIYRMFNVHNSVYEYK